MKWQLEKKIKIKISYYFNMNSLSIPSGLKIESNLHTQSLIFTNSNNVLSDKVYDRLYNTHLTDISTKSRKKNHMVLTEKLKKNLKLK